MVALLRAWSPPVLAGVGAGLWIAPGFGLLVAGLMIWLDDLLPDPPPMRERSHG